MPKLMNTCGKCEYCLTGRESLCDNAQFIGLYYGGGFAEQVCCSASQLIRVPEGISDTDAAALQISFATAWHMLFTRGHLQVGETVLINSVGSGVGSAALELARLAGAVTIGSASSSSTLEFAKSLGLDVGINYAEEDLPERVRSVTEGRGVDLVFEHVGGELFQQSLQCMAKDGRLVTCGAHSGEVVPIDVIPLFRGQHSIIGSFVYTENELRKVLHLASEGKIKPVIHATFALEDARLAMESLEVRTHFGKVILVP
jgi:NADPH:quinone reductase-like Zn-dependent oxidoreductase